MKRYFLAIIMLISFSSIAKDLSSFYLESRTRILLAGERHTNDQARDIFSESLEDFKRRGGDTLGLEMVESHKQFLLDNFLQKRENSEYELYEYLRVRWQYNTESYMKLITRARSLDLKLLAIDLDKRKRPAETALYPVPPEISKVRAAREAHMAKVLCQAEFQKIVIIIGSFRALDKFLPTALRKECYAESESINLSKL
ncbi:ChaN family lipoprotein [Halobacteriovorax marinus]|uniref:ChaN family lipoprotein n=1 Tax=Halobacteriovorax marinus TaxID=97084 RepID=UPI003A92E95E